MTDKERLQMAIEELEKRIKYVDIALADKDYREAAVKEATQKMRERQKRYPELLKELKKSLQMIS